MATIKEIIAREILDSRANPTVEVDVVLDSGVWGRAAVPSGASTGSFEAIELRDDDKSRFVGKGVLKPLQNIRDIIAPNIIGKSVFGQEDIDKTLLDLDGTKNKSKLGANAILGVSMAVAVAAARSKEVPLYRYLNRNDKLTMPAPMFNIINGGRHASDSTDFQEFMVMPLGFDKFSEALRAGVEIYHALAATLRGRSLGTTVGDEGGFAPTLPTNRAAIEIVVKAIEKAGYRPGEQVYIALDVAAAELESSPKQYSLTRENVVYSGEQFVGMYESWIKDYPIISIEDGLGEDDWDNWSLMTEKVGSKVQLVGDDLYTTNTDRIIKGIDTKASNAVLIKLNQIGTITETLQAVEMTEKAGWGTVISHRSGETEDTLIADLAVATAAGQIKSGAPSRGERTAKYNQLLRIEQELGDKAVYAGRTVFEKFL